MFKKYGLRVKLSLAIALSMFALAMGLLLALHFSLKNIFEDTLVSHHSATIKNVAAGFDAGLGVGHATLDVLVRDAILGDAFKSKNSISVFDKGACFFYEGANRNLHADQNLCGTLLKYPKIEFHKGLSLVFEGKSTIVLFHKPTKLFGKEGSLVAGASFQESSLFSGISQLESFFVLNGQRQVVYSKQANKLQMVVPPGVSSALDRAIAGSATAGISAGISGGEMLIAAMPIKNTGWVIGTEEELAQYLIPLENLTKRTFLWLITILSLGALGLVMLISRVVSPLSRLTSRAKDRQYSQANLAELVEKEGGEILELARALDWRTKLLASSKAELEQALDQYEMLTEHSSDVICRMAPAGILEYVSPASSTLLGVSPVQARLQNFLEFVAVEDAVKVRASISEALKSSLPITIQHRTRKAANNIQWLETTFKAITREEGSVELVSVSRDITLRKTREDYLNHLAHHDPLTGLANRTSLQYAMSELVSNDEACAVLLLDLDKFKQVNDTLGHDTGDELLIEMAKRLKASVRSSDLVVRLGGDEFVILVRDSVSPEKAAISVANKILETIKPTLVTEKGHTLRIHTSIGIAIAPMHGKNPSEVLKRADEAMYVSKSKGGGSYYVYEESLAQKSAETAMLQEEFLEALRNDEVDLYYQPIKQTKTGKTVAVEAYLRWEHPVQGLLLPEVLMQLASSEEASVLILRNSLKRGAYLLSEAPRAIKLVLNISGKQAGLRDFVNIVRDSMREYPELHNNLELDLPESVLSSSPDRFSKIINELSETGINVALDNFGRGYTYLSHLATFGISGLRLDASLVRDLHKSQGNIVLAQGLLSLANTLELKVTAKGIEDHAQLEQMSQLGCEYIQGFYIAKPMEVSQLLPYLSKE